MRAERQSLPHGAIGYVLSAYKGTAKKPDGHGLQRRFAWLDEAGKNWEGGIVEFAKHLQEKFELSRPPRDGYIHSILRARGKSAFHILHPHKRKPKPTAASIKPVQAALNGVVDRKSLRAMVMSLFDMLADTPENRAFIARVGAEAWNRLAGLKA
jgi:hypothetical protein